MKRFFCILAITIGSLLVLLTGCWYAFCYWAKNSWQTIEPPPCHASWSQQQCADLLEIDNALRSPDIAALAYFCHREQLSPATQWLMERKWGMLPALLLGWRDLGMPARAALHETMRTGKGDVLLSSGIPVADFALKCHKTELLREMIRRGADPNHVYISWHTPDYPHHGDIRTNLIWETFDGHSLNCETVIRQDERLELLEFMHAHGGSVTTVPNKWLAGAYLLMPIANSNDNDGGRATAWALRHGMPLSDEDKQNCVQYMQERAPECLRELQQEGLLPEAL